MYNNNRHPTVSLLPLEASGPDVGVMDDVLNRHWQIYSTAKLLVFIDWGEPRHTVPFLLLLIYGCRTFVCVVLVPALFTFLYVLSVFYVLEFGHI